MQKVRSLGRALGREADGGGAFRELMRVEVRSGRAEGQPHSYKEQMRAESMLEDRKLSTGIFIEGDCAYRGQGRRRRQRTLTLPARRRALID